MFFDGLVAYTACSKSIGGMLRKSAAIKVGRCSEERMLMAA
jgi:hypothetical protein